MGRALFQHKKMSAGTCQTLKCKWRIYKIILTHQEADVNGGKSDKQRIN